MNGKALVACATAALGIAALTSASFLTPTLTPAAPSTLGSENRSPSTSQEDLLHKGFPAVSNPRRAAIQQVEGRTYAELVADWANMEHLTVTIEGSMILDWTLSTMSRTIPNNLYVLRLIQEGRDHPREIGREVERQLDFELQRYSELLRRTNLDSLISTESDRAADEMAYYREHLRYKSSRLEVMRVIRSIYNSFYTLIALRQIDDAAPMLRWAEMEWSAQRGGVDMDVWIIDQYVQRGGLKGTPQGERWNQERGTAVFSDRESIARSCWNESWSISDPLVLRAGANTSTLRKIEVPRIPQKLPINDTPMEFVEKFALLGLLK
jgi:hypothetical protein